MLSTKDGHDSGGTRMPASANTFQRACCASQTKPMPECHPERSEGSFIGRRPFASLRMTKHDGLVFEMHCPQGPRPYRDDGFPNLLHPPHTIIFRREEVRHCSKSFTTV